MTAPETTTYAERKATAKQTPRRWARRLRGGSGRSARPIWRQPVTLAAVTTIVLWLLAAVLAPLVAPYDPLESVGGPFSAPTAEFWFGTDALGRDVASRVIYGARLSIPLALAIVVLALVVGGLLGLVAGYIGRWLDEVAMRLTDLVFAFPQIILAMAVTAAFGPSTRNAVLALVLVSWPVYTRVIRGAVLTVRAEDYLNAARLLGVGPLRALRRDVVPNSVGPALVLATLELGNAVLMLAALSFLGLGPRPPEAEWGAMIALGAQDLTKWWVSAFPGLAILTVVLAFNILGDALRDQLDPRFSKGR
jgi:peptide/nickel transport system permease protein